MIDFYAQIESGLLAILQDAPGLTGVRVWETEVREVLFTGEALSKGFRGEELPAVMITAALDPSRSSPFTTGQIQYKIPAQVLIVTRAQKGRDARAEALGLARAAEAAIHGARRSDELLGPNTFVTGEVVSSFVVVEQKPLCFAVASIAVEVTKVVEL
ncbi:MAG: hypothetical protein AMXMBFR13_12450 [Phycisphaerae bacterium]